MADDPLDQYSRLPPRDQALADMEWERSPAAMFGREALGFTAGLVNPFDLLGAGVRAFNYGRGAPSGPGPVQKTLDQWAAEGPFGNVMGSLTGPGYAWARTLGRATPREARELVPLLWGIGYPMRNLYDIFTGEDDRRAARQRAREYGAAGYADGGAPDPLDQYGVNAPRSWERMDRFTLQNQPELLEPPGDLPRGDPVGPPGFSWGAAMPQSPEEAEWHRRLPLAEMSWLLSPASGYSGGYRLAEGVANRDPWQAALGLGQIGTSMLWPAPGVGPGLGAPRAAPRTAGPGAPIPEGHRAGVSAYEQWLRDRGIPPAPPPDRLIGPGGAIIPNPAVARPQPAPVVSSAVRDFHALPHGPAFPRMEGVSPVEARNAFMALRQGNGDFEAAIASLGSVRPDSGTVALLRSWQAAGVDGAAALRYFQGLRELRNLERPPHGGHADGGPVAEPEHEGWFQQFLRKARELKRRQSFEDYGVEPAQAAAKWYNDPPAYAAVTEPPIAFALGAMDSHPIPRLGWIGPMHHKAEQGEPEYQKATHEMMWTRMNNPIPYYAGMGLGLAGTVPMFGRLTVPWTAAVLATDPGVQRAVRGIFSRADGGEVLEQYFSPTLKQHVR